MLRPRAREGRAVTVVRRPGLDAGTAPGLVPAPVVALAVTLLLALAGCGGGEDPDTAEEPSRATRECREEWKDLGGEIAGREERTNPSALAPRWSSISAAVEHYVAAADSSDCDETLAAEKKAVAALTAFSARLARFDMELRLAQVREDAQRYARGPRPPAPKATPSSKGKKGGKQKRAPRPPRPAEVAAALKTLTRQAPRATAQQGPGWQQARAIDLSDAKAVKKAVKDLAFLSEESKAYRSASEALATIRPALAATQD